MWSKANHCIKKCDTPDSRPCFRESLHSRLLSSHVPQHPTPYHNPHELSRMKAIIQIADTKMGSNMCCMCVVSLFGEEYGCLVRCNICNIMCEAWASTFFPCHDILALRTCYKGIWWCIMKEVCCVPSSKPFFHILHPIGTQNFAFMCLLDLFACFLCDSRKWCTMKQVCCIPSSKPFSISCIQVEHKILLLCVFLSYYLGSQVIPSLSDNR